jgi:hypothetical protein
MMKMVNAFDLAIQKFTEEELDPHMEVNNGTKERYVFTITMPTGEKEVEIALHGCLTEEYDIVIIVYIDMGDHWLDQQYTHQKGEPLNAGWVKYEEPAQDEEPGMDWEDEVYGDDEDFID